MEKDFGIVQNSIPEHGRNKKQNPIRFFVQSGSGAPTITAGSAAGIAAAHAAHLHPLRRMADAGPISFFSPKNLIRNSQAGLLTQHHRPAQSSRLSPMTSCARLRFTAAVLSETLTPFPFHPRDARGHLQTPMYSVFKPVVRIGDEPQAAPAPLRAKIRSALERVHASSAASLPRRKTTRSGGNRPSRRHSAGAMDAESKRRA